MTEDNITLKEKLDIEIKRLVLLDAVQYELEREKIANQFGIRVGKLDEFINTERKKTEEEKSETVLFPKIEPWLDEVALSTLLDEIFTILNRFISFNSDSEPTAAALWIMHTYTIEAAYITP